MRSPIVRAKMRGEYPIKTPDRPFFDELPDNSWRGQRAFIIGGGPSLKGFDFERLKGKGKIIAINAAFKFCMFADIMFFMDKANFYQPLINNRFNDNGIKKSWDEFEGYKVFLDLLQKRAIPGCYMLYANSALREGVTHTMKKGLIHGNNSGHGALNLAYCLGANPIYLLGYDFYFVGPKKQRGHFHKVYNHELSEAGFKNFIKFFKKSSEILRRMRVQVYNCNPKSHLKFFDFSDIDEVLNG